MKMMNNRYTEPATALKHVRNGTAPFLLAAAMAVTGFLPSPAKAQITPDTAAADCLGRINAVDNPQELANNQGALLSVKRCIDLGIDPPLKTRPDWGRSPASGVAKTQIPGLTCPPFATCLYSARVNTTGSQSLNYGIGGTGNSINDAPPGTYTAPQFTGPVPPAVPEHLEGGGAIYFHGDAVLTPPNTSLVYPDAGMNYYADGGRENINNGHVMVPAPPNGDVMAQQPIIINDDAVINFDQYGAIIQLPRDMHGTIAGRQVQGGDLIIVRHEGAMNLPAGTGIYPFGSEASGAIPGNVAMTVTDEDDPGTDVWWSW